MPIGLSSKAYWSIQNAVRALDILEYVWLQQRLFGEAEYKTFDKLASANLLP